MRVLLFFPSFPSIGGTESVMTFLANGLSRKGYSVFICSSTSTTDIPYPALDSEVILLKLPVKNFYSKTNVSILHDLLIEYSIDIVINNYTLENGVEFCNSAIRGTNVKLVSLHHGAITYNDIFLRYLINRKGLKGHLYNSFFCLYRYLKNWKIIRLHKINIKYSDVYVLLSDSFKKYLPVSNKIKVINNALSYPFSETNKFPEKEKIVLFVGRLVDFHKRIILSLDIWQKVWLLHRDWSYYILGEGEDKQLIEGYIKKNDIHNVHLLGFQNPIEFYQKSSIFMMTSSFEGWGLVINEAKQNFCVPIAMNTFDSLYDIIKNNEDGFIIDNMDIDGYCSSLDTLMSNKELREKFAMNGYENIKKFSQENILDKWVALLSSLK